MIGTSPPKPSLRLDPHAGGRGPIVLDRHRIFILPTPEGLLFGVILLAIFLGAVNDNNSLAHAFAFLVTGTALASIFHTLRNLQGLRLVPRSPAPAFAGGQTVFEVSVEHPDSTPRRGIEFQLGHAPSAGIDCPPDTATRVSLTLSPTQRGRRAIGPLRVSTRYPLGIFRAWSVIDWNMHYLVYPRPADRAPRQRRDEPGDRIRWSGTDFSNLRSYQPGDAPRRIHWKAFARRQGLMVRQFSAGDETQVWLDWHALQGDTEDRLSRLCRAVLDAEATGVRYGLLLPGVRLEPASGGAHSARCFEALALYEARR